MVNAHLIPQATAKSIENISEQNKTIDPVVQDICLHAYECYSLRREGFAFSEYLEEQILTPRQVNQFANESLNIPLPEKIFSIRGVITSRLINTSYSHGYNDFYLAGAGATLDYLGTNINGHLDEKTRISVYGSPGISFLNRATNVDAIVYGNIEDQMLLCAKDVKLRIKGNIGNIMISSVNCCGIILEGELDRSVIFEHNKRLYFAVHSDASYRFLSEYKKTNGGIARIEKIDQKKWDAGERQ